MKIITAKIERLHEPDEKKLKKEFKKLKGNVYKVDPRGATDIVWVEFPVNVFLSLINVRNSEFVEFILSQVDEQADLVTVLQINKDEEGEADNFLKALETYGIINAI